MKRSSSPTKVLNSSPDPRMMTRSERQPEVIVDFVFEDGLFFIAIINASTIPAFNVSVAFDKKFTGVEGTKAISALPLFRKIPFLASNT